jgi:hypothetical protein
MNFRISSGSMGLVLIGVFLRLVALELRELSVVAMISVTAYLVNGAI